MRDLELGRLVRALRRRRGWRQADCASRAGVHRSTWSNLERGLVERMGVAAVRRCLAVLEVRLELMPRWRGAELDRFLDEAHAGMQAAWKSRLERWEWVVRPEVSFNRYGERGRVDLLAFHPRRRILLVIEIKTEIADVQSLLGALDVKVRAAPHTSRELGWPQPSVVVPALVVADHSTNRRRLARVGTLFTHLPTRGKAAVGWLRRPDADAGGLLILSILSGANPGRVRRDGTARVRLARSRPRVAETGSAGRGPPHAA